MNIQVTKRDGNTEDLDLDKTTRSFFMRVKVIW